MNDDSSGHDRIERQHTFEKSIYEAFCSTLQQTILQLPHIADATLTLSQGEDALTDADDEEVKNVRMHRGQAQSTKHRI